MTDELIGLALDETREKMMRGVEHTKTEFATVRTGRAVPALIEKLKVDYYGAEVVLQQIAGITVRTSAPDSSLPPYGTRITRVCSGAAPALEYRLHDVCELSLGPQGRHPGDRRLRR